MSALAQLFSILHSILIATAQWCKEASLVPHQRQLNLSHLHSSSPSVSASLPASGEASSAAWERGDSTAHATALQQPGLRAHRAVQSQTLLRQHPELTAYSSCQPVPDCSWVETACLGGHGSPGPWEQGCCLLLSWMALSSTVQPFT